MTADQLYKMLGLALANNEIKGTDRIIVSSDPEGNTFGFLAEVSKEDDGRLIIWPDRNADYEEL